MDMEFFINTAFFAAAQGLFLSVVLFFVKRGNRSANVFLAVLILVISLWTAEFAAYFTNQFNRFPHLLFSTVGFPLLYGPLLFFYTKALKGKNFFANKWNWLHFLPFLLHTFYYMDFFLEPTEVKLATIEALRDMKNPPSFSISFFCNESIKFIHLVIYLFIVKRIYTTANFLKFQKKWIKHLLIGLALLALFDLSHLLTLILFKYDYLFMIARGVLLSGTLIIYYIGYSTFRQPEIISGEAKKNKPTSRYEKSALPKQKADLYLQRLLEKMEMEKYYLDSDLKLKKLASELDISTHHLSQILNKYLQKSFFDFVNEYRVKAVQEMLCNPAYSNFTILSIAYDAGFKTKASFNTAFKKFTQLTPSQYRKKIKEQAE